MALPMMLPTLIGPCTIDCEHSCDVPSGVRLGEVPPSRHQWNDVLVCPNCGRQFLCYPPTPSVTGHA
jgi:hypothetical protein